jgi:gluconolactonase
MLAALLALPTWSQGGGKEKYPTLGKIERMDPRMDELVPKGAKIEKILDGHVWTEGPAWVKDGNYLLFSDIPRNKIYKWQEGKGATVWLHPSGYTGKKPRENETGKDEPGSNGLEISPDGKWLVVPEHGDRQISKVLIADPKKKVVLASHYMEKRLNSPNDAVFHSNGDIYFTDPPYGMTKHWDDPARELDFCGIYRIGKDGGKLTLLHKDMTRPNGIAFSLDEKTLVIANSDPKQAVWMAFPVEKDGTLGKGTVFHDATKEVGKKDRLGLPDGMCIDAKGNFFATGPGGVYVFTPKGELLGLINTGERTSNCTFGDDGSTLYMTTDHYITRIKLNTKGKGF